MPWHEKAQPSPFADTDLNGDVLASQYHLDLILDDALREAVLASEHEADAGDKRPIHELINEL